MKILVTGANGFLGQAAVNLFERAGHEVVATARSSKGNRIACDLSAPRALMSLLDTEVPEAVVNCAAVVDFGHGCLEALYPVNVLSVALIAGWCKKNKAYLAQVSTVAVHGCSSLLVGPGSGINADTDYGKSKWLAERLVEASGVTSSRVRFSGIFGKMGPDHLGLNRAIRAADDGQYPTVVGIGQARRNYIYVEDAAHVLLQCVEQQLDGVRWAGGAEVLTIAQMMQQICDAYKRGESPVFTEGPEAVDQVVVSSSDLPVGLNFRAALIAEL